VPLRRLQLFELEDLPWFPDTIRDLSTDYLHFMQMRFCCTNHLLVGWDRLAGEGLHCG
jgi:hypothetical protein